MPPMANRILVADDDRAIREAVARALELERARATGAMIDLTADQPVDALVSAQYDSPRRRRTA